MHHFLFAEARQKKRCIERMLFGRARREESVELLIGVLFRQTLHRLGHLDPAGHSRPSLFLQELRHDDHVVNDAVVVQPVLLFQAHHELIEIVGRDVLSGRAVGKVIAEPIEDGFVLAKRVRLLQAFDKFEVSVGCDMERRALRLFVGSSVTWYAERPACTRPLDC